MSAEPIGVIMKSYIETAAIITASGSAIFWFMSAAGSLPSIKAGMDELDKVTELSSALHKMNRCNFWAASLMGVTALLSVWLRFLR